MPVADLSRPVPAGPALVALADRCVQCGLCLPHCPTYRLDATETESPRGRIAYMKALAMPSLAPTDLGDLHLDHCLGCRRCEGVCPAGVEYGALLVAGRSAQARRRPLPASLRRTLAWLASPRRLAIVLRAYRALHPVLPRRWRPLPAPPPAPSTPAETAAPGAAALFVGCIAREYEAPARAALRLLASAAGFALRGADGQGCCGAAAAHAGDEAGAARLAEANRAAFAGAPRVLCLASGCQPTLAGSLAGVAPVEDATVAIAARAGSLRFRDAAGLRVAWHRPCTQFALAGSVAATRALLARVPGLELVELPDTGCCGGAGLHMLQYPARAARLREPLLEALARSGASELLSANMGCRLHLGNGTSLPVRHPLELLADHLE